MIDKQCAESLNTLLHPQKGEKVIVIGDSTSTQIIPPVIEEIRKTVSPVVLDLDVYERPLAEVPEDLASAVQGADLLFYAIDRHSKERPFREALNNLVRNSEGRVSNLLSATPEVIQSAFASDIKQTQDLTKRLYDYMLNVSDIKVEAEGTELIISFDPEYNWVKSDGISQKGKTRNPIPAEVYTFPINVEGKLSINTIYSGLMGILESEEILERVAKTPIKWDIAEDRITDVTCDDQEIERLVRNYVFENENGDRIGEFGMGTNLGIKTLLGIIMHDEKAMIHLANGDPKKKETNADYKSPVHNDGGIYKPTITDLDTNREIMIQGKYTDIVTA